MITSEPCTSFQSNQMSTSNYSPKLKHCKCLIPSSITKMKILQLLDQNENTSISSWILKLWDDVVIKQIRMILIFDFIPHFINPTRNWQKITKICKSHITMYEWVSKNLWIEWYIFFIPFPFVLYICVYCI